MAAYGFAYDVFLSHSSKDKVIVRNLAERLQNEGLRVWFDEWVIRPGDSVPRKIDQGLEQSAVLVLCMSASSLGSDWAAVESQTLRFADPVNRELLFIPIRLDDTEPRASLRRFAYVDWRNGGNDEAFSRLLNACRRPKEQIPLISKMVKPTPKTKIDGRGFRELECPTEINAIALSADGIRIVIGARDKTVRVWDFEGNAPPRVLKGHQDVIWGVALSADGRRAVSGSQDRSMRVWDLEGEAAPRILHGVEAPISSVALSADGKWVAFGAWGDDLGIWDLEGKAPPRPRLLKGHTNTVRGAALSADGKRVVSGSADRTVRVWDIEGNALTRVLKGHTGEVKAVALSADGRRAVSGSEDRTMRVWDLESNTPTRVLEGHTDTVRGVALSADGRWAVSGSDDRTMRVWDLEGNTVSRVFEASSGAIWFVALSADGRRAVSCSRRTLRIWELDGDAEQVESERRVRYTNAKVIVVGNTHSGKTGITVRLAHDLPPSRWASTSGVWSTQWPLHELPAEVGWDRELWLWDFGGQADQRLIHQLYLDHAAAVLLMFDGDSDMVLPGLREWQQALARSLPPSVPVLLLAGRTDVGSRFDRARVQEFARANNYPFFETSAETNRGIPEVREALLKAVAWGSLDQYDSPSRFKRLKEEILRVRDEGGVALATFKELESVLAARLPAEFDFSTEELRTVVWLLDGPGVVKELNFGSYILLRPEWINIYAQAVIRTLDAAETGLGYLPVQAIREGKLIFQPSHVGGQPVEEKRLRPEDEQIVLQHMESTLLARRLCLQQDGDLVFPNYCGRERPVGPVPPQYFVSYTVDGFLDDIHTTLVVKLAHCGAFRLKELWRDAADFETLAGKKLVGIRLLRREEAGGEILAHYVEGVTGEEQVIFANYIHEHLKEQSTAKVQRLRHYICPRCNEPVRNRELAMERLIEEGERATIRCPRCENLVYLWDRIEELYADEIIRKQVEALRTGEAIDLDARRLGKLLVHEVSARILSVDQKCMEIPQEGDEGIDLEVEFTDREGRGTARHMYLQLKAGNSHLAPPRKSDGAEIFRIDKQRWVRYWVKMCANGPVMLVIGTFSDSEKRGARPDKREFADVRWMEIGEHLRMESANGTKPVKQIVFKGERLDAGSVLRWRDKVLRRLSNR